MRMRKLPWAEDFLKEQEVVLKDAAELAGSWKQKLKRRASCGNWNRQGRLLGEHGPEISGYRLGWN